MRKAKSFDERFFSRVQKTEGCWLWVGSAHPLGYGRYSATERAHQAAYRHFFGPIPRGMCVCHKCDVPACVNPDHLFLGTRSENNEDRAMKGRTSRASRNAGGRHGLSKLTDDQVRTIRNMRNAGAKLKEIAVKFGVSEALICLVAQGKRWAHIDGVAA